MSGDSSEAGRRPLRLYPSDLIGLLSYESLELPADPGLTVVTDSPADAAATDGRAQLAQWTETRERLAAVEVPTSA